MRVAQTLLADDTVKWCGVIFTRYEFGSCGTLSHLFDRPLKEAMEQCSLDDWSVSHYCLLWANLFPALTVNLHCGLVGIILSTH